MMVSAPLPLIALLIGWLGASRGLPDWAVLACALIAFGAGGYSGFVGAVSEARQGKLDIDFLMIAAALGAELARPLAPADMGRLMAAAKRHFAGKADMGSVSAAVKGVLSA